MLYWHALWPGGLRWWVVTLLELGHIPEFFFFSFHKLWKGRHERFQVPPGTRWPSSTLFSLHQWLRCAQQMAIAALLSPVKAGPGPSPRERGRERGEGSSGLMLNFTPHGFRICETRSWWTGRWRWRIEGWCWCLTSLKVTVHTLCSDELWQPEC